jgi:adenosine deaminase
MRIGRMHRRRELRCEANEMTGCETIPKVELHCHLDGIFDPPMLRDAQKRGVRLPISPEALEAAYPVRGYEEFVRWFRTVEPFEGDLERFKPFLAIHLERLRAQHVVYTEIMIASSEIPRDRGELIGRVSEFREWVNRQEDRAIQVEFLAAIGRNRTPERVAELADRILMLHDAGLIAGVALAGLEQGYPVRPFRNTFARFREAGLSIEIHAGEWCGPESVWDALAHGFPDRLGHAVAVFQDSRLVERCRKERIHLEFCPTSNLKTGSIRRIEDHPVRVARELGLHFGINTDDPGAFECSMASEYQLLETVFGFGPDDLRKITADALAARFQPRLRYLAP